jgi:hypothetical protein
MGMYRTSSILTKIYICNYAWDKRLGMLCISLAIFYQSKTHFRETLISRNEMHKKAFKVHKREIF